MITDGHAIGIRRDLNGVLFLDTALQTAVDKSEDVICLEILLPEVCSTKIVITFCPKMV